MTSNTYYRKGYLVLMVLILSLAFNHCSPPQPNGDLYIQVLDEDANKVTEAVVTLYSSFEDYQNQTNPLSTKFTDEDGFAVFLQLEGGNYFFSVNNGSSNNQDGKNETFVVETEIGFRNEEIVIISQSLSSLLATPEGKLWKVNENFEDNDCLLDNTKIFYSNFTFVESAGANLCDNGLDSELTGRWDIVGNSTIILLTDTITQENNALIIANISDTSLVVIENNVVLLYKAILE
ncbi:hypothetical protein V6R21_20605 [Limibacter armeniacum]|uniref:hypothetical protein n=1 Tax=Limibacter armeniacum TaxID=466084 RepID=UPI002FE5B8BC